MKQGSTRRAGRAKRFERNGRLAGAGATRAKHRGDEIETLRRARAAATVATRRYAADLDENRHADAEEIESDFRPPDLRVDLDGLAAHFASPLGRNPEPIRNYHRERPVPDAVREHATPASVLVPLVRRETGLGVIVTRRDPSISYAGQVCYPGGRRDPGDVDAETTALREAHEEIGLDPAAVSILGRLGVYHTQSGYRITPVVGVVRPPLSLVPARGEVSEIHELPLDALTTAAHYRIWRRDPVRGEAFFAFEYGGVRITGPTVCMSMGFYEALAQSVRTPSRPA